MKKTTTVLNEQEQKKITKLFWILALLPFFLVASILLLQSEDDLPPVSMLDNPPELQASLILAKKSVKEDTVIGRFWQVNRTSVKYREISPLEPMPSFLPKTSVLSNTLELIFVL